MKIVVICGAGIVSGKEVMSLALLKGLHARGHECVCITSSWGSMLFRERLTEMGVPYKVFRIGFISKTLQWAAIRMTLHQLMYLPGVYVRYWRLRRTVRPDLVIHTNFHHVFLLFPVLFGRNYYWSHEVIDQTGFYSKLFRMFRKKVSLFIGVSGAVGNSLRKIVGDDLVAVIRNGIPPPAGSPSKGSVTGGVLAIIGQVSRPKGHALLIEALKTVEAAVPSVRLRIVGHGDARFVDELKKQISDTNLESKVEWTGQLVNKEEMYRGVDVVVVPTIIQDSYPTTIMESCYFGIPVVGSDTGGIPEMIAEGVNGFVFQAGDANALSEKLIAALTHADAGKLRESSRIFALTNFAVEKFVTEFEKAAEGIK